MANPGMIYVVPAKGALVRDDKTRLQVPAEGMLVPAGDPYWLALLQFGDVIEQAAPPAGAQ